MLAGNNNGGGVQGGGSVGLLRLVHLSHPVCINAKFFGIRLQVLGSNDGTQMQVFAHHLPACRKIVERACC